MFASEEDAGPFGQSSSSQAILPGHVPMLQHQKSSRVSGNLKRRCHISYLKIRDLEITGMVSFRKSLDSETLGTDTHTHTGTNTKKTYTCWCQKFKDKSDKCTTVLIGAPPLPTLNLQGQRQGEEVGLGNDEIVATPKWWRFWRTLDPKNISFHHTGWNNETSMSYITLKRISIKILRSFWIDLSKIMHQLLSWSSPQCANPASGW